MMIHKCLTNTGYAARKRKRNIDHLRNVPNSDKSLTSGARGRGKRVRLYSSLKSLGSSFGKRR
jgi:hypothetical protein